MSSSQLQWPSLKDALIPAQKMPLLHESTEIWLKEPVKEKLYCVDPGVLIEISLDLYLIKGDFQYDGTDEKTSSFASKGNNVIIIKIVKKCQVYLSKHENKLIAERFFRCSLGCCSCIVFISEEVCCH